MDSMSASKKQNETSGKVDHLKVKTKEYGDTNQE